MSSIHDAYGARNRELRAIRRSNMLALRQFNAITIADINEILGLSSGDVGNDINWLRRNGVEVPAKSSHRSLGQIVLLWQQAMRRELPGNAAPFTDQIVLAMEKAIGIEALEERVREMIPSLLPRIAMARTPRSPPAWAGTTNLHWQVLNLCTNGGSPHFEIEDGVLDIRRELLCFSSPCPVLAEDLARALTVQFLTRVTTRTASDDLFTEQVVTAIDRAIAGLSDARRSVITAYLKSARKEQVFARIARQRKCSRENTNQLFWCGIAEIRDVVLPMLPQLENVPAPRAAMVPRDRGPRRAPA